MLFDENGEVRKIDIELLEILLDEYSDVDTKSYIEYLIKEFKMNNNKDNVQHRLNLLLDIKKTNT